MEGETVHSENIAARVGSKPTTAVGDGSLSILRRELRRVKFWPEYQSERKRVDKWKKIV